MQQEEVLHRSGLVLQSALQPLLSRVQSSKTRSVACITRDIHDLEQIARRGPPLTANDLPAFANAVGNLHSDINDREFLLEKVLVLMSRLPDDSTFAKRAQEYVVDLLYKDLPHPPTGFLSTFKTLLSTPAGAENASYAFRSADGSNYNVLSPSLGQAGQPYARSVPSTHIQTFSSLPDPGVVFDTLLCRPKDEFVPHPGGLSSLFFAFADLIIHSIFNTNMYDWTINDTSSYLDLSILYGHTVEQVESMRRKDGSGKIWNDAFADRRLLFMPPSVCALAVLFSRHHNYIAEKILGLNERGSYASPPPDEKITRFAQDDEIFHRARLVNTAFFMQIILTDYVGGILGLVRDGLTWRLNPLALFRESEHGISPRGGGNAVSIEFNLLYHWHASISAKDEKRLNGLFGRVFEGTDPRTISIKEFREVIREKIVPSGDAQTWSFDGLQRVPGGSFDDQDLARILQDATEQRAGAFRARGCPAVMRVVEILAIEQGRKWGACTLNEFRNFLGLQPYASFREWNPDPDIHLAAEKLYGHIDNLELHVGLQAEETKPPIPGAGLCPGYTISRAILADAVCLTRGDRFLTVDFTPYNLTTWGYQYCMVDTADGSYGGMLNKLLFGLLPTHYPAGSVYAHFPFMTPDFIRPCLASRSRDMVPFYDWSRPDQTEKSAIPVSANIIGSADRQLDGLYKQRISKLTGGVDVDVGKVRTCIIDETLSAVAFTTMVKNLVTKSSALASSDTMVIDIVKDVVNKVPIYWAANFILGLPVTTVDSVWGGRSVAQWLGLFGDVTRYIYLNNDPVYDWTMHKAALEATNEIIHYLRNRLIRHSKGVISLKGASDVLVASVMTSNVQNDKFIAKVLSATKHYDIQTVACSIFDETVPSALLFSAALSSVVEYYSDPCRKEELQKLIQLSTDATKDHMGDIMGFVDRALDGKLDLGQVRDGPLPPCLVIGGQEIKMDRQKGLISRELFSKVAPQIIQTIFSLENIRFPQSGMVNGELY
ncbi:heme peroxidase [Paxillus ammoniavirescens]|nr:heme peroxidase [Paxillus ammoniavirescens]